MMGGTANVSIGRLVELSDSDVGVRVRTLELVLLTFDIRQARTSRAMGFSVVGC